MPRTATSLPIFSCLPSRASADGGRGVDGAHLAVEVDGDGEGAGDVDVHAVGEPGGERRSDPVAGAEAHLAGAEQGADGGGLAAELDALSVDDQSDLGTGRGGELLRDPHAAHDGGDHQQDHEEGPGGGAVPVRRLRGRAGAPAEASPGRASGLSSGTGDNSSMLGSGSQADGVVGLGPGGRRRDGRLSGGEGARHHGLGLGHHGGLDLGGGVEQLADRRELVEIVGERQPGGRVVRLGTRRRR